MNQNDNILNHVLLKTILYNMPGGFFIYHADGDEALVFANDNIFHLYGCDDAEEFQKLTGNTFGGMVHPDDLDRVEQEISGQIKKNDNAKRLDYVEYRIIRKDKTVRWVEDYGRLVHGSDGAPYFYVFISDATEKKLLLGEIARRDEQQRIIAEMAKDIVFDISYETGSIDVYGQFEKRFGRMPKTEDFLGLLPGEQGKDTVMDLILHDTAVPASEITSQIQDVTIPAANGENLWASCQLAQFHRDSGDLSRVVGRLLDTHEQTLRELSYRQDAERDYMTGLLNRKMIQTIIGDHIRQATAPTLYMAALFDIDDFKQINDRHGHPAGDLILTHVSSHMEETLGKEAFCARIGGDEFLAFFPNAEDRARCIGMIEDFIAFSRDRGQKQQFGSVRITLSAGITFGQGSKSSFAELYNQADKALYKAKQIGKQTYYIYTPPISNGSPGISRRD